MKKIKLLMEIIKASTKAKIITSAICVGVLAVGGGITYGVVSNNNNRIEDNAPSQEVSTTYESEDEYNKSDEEVAEKSETAPVEEEKKVEATTSTNTEKDTTQPNSTTFDTKANGARTSSNSPSNSGGSSNTQTQTPTQTPSYKAAGIDWDLTNKLNSWLASKFSISSLYRSSEVLAACKDVLISGSSFPNWIIDGYTDKNPKVINKYISHTTGNVVFTESHANDDPVNLLSLSKLIINTDIMYRGMPSRQYMYCYAKYDGTGNLIITMLQLRVN